MSTLMPHPIGQWTKYIGIYLLLGITSPALAQDTRIPVEELPASLTDLPIKELPQSVENPTLPVEESTRDLSKINPAKEIQQLNATNSQFVLQKQYRECMQSTRLSGRDETLGATRTDSCIKELDELKKQFTPELRAAADRVIQENEERETKQREAFAEAAALDQANAKSETEYARGDKVQRGQLVELANCQAEAINMEKFSVADCPKRLGLEDEDIQALDRYLSAQLADKRTP